jgi:hypothetical protein
LSRWFRMYSDVLDDPKVQKLPPELFKAWVNLLCLASRNDGVLPAIEDIAFALRMSQDVTVTVTAELVTRGLLDECDGLAPHNWAERQFKSDTPEDAKERKRKQRQREKQQQNPDNVTACHSDSHGEVTPPEQSRTEQSRAEQTPAHTEGEELSKEVQGYLDSRTDDLTEWEVRFLISIKWSNSLSKAQRETLKGIREKLAPRDGSKPLPSVKKGTPQFDAWIAYYRRTGRPTAFYEKQDAITVFSEYPPQEQAA